jgi:hypothetical protein
MADFIAFFFKFKTLPHIVKMEKTLSGNSISTTGLFGQEGDLRRWIPPERVGSVPTALRLAAPVLTPAEGRNFLMHYSYRFSWGGNNGSCNVCLSSFKILFYHKK